MRLPWCSAGSTNLRRSPPLTIVLLHKQWQLWRQAQFRCHRNGSRFYALHRCHGRAARACRRDGESQRGPEIGNLRAAACGGETPSAVRQLLRLQDEERRRIARDLHDSTAQHLVALNAILQQLQNSLPPPLSHKSRRLFAETEDLAVYALREVRTLSYLLYPPMLDEHGLEDAPSRWWVSLF